VLLEDKGGPPSAAAEESIEIGATYRSVQQCSCCIQQCTDGQPEACLLSLRSRLHERSSSPVQHGVNVHHSLTVQHSLLCNISFLCDVVFIVQHSYIVQQALVALHESS